MGRKQNARQPKKIDRPSIGIGGQDIHNQPRQEQHWWMAICTEFNRRGYFRFGCNLGLATRSAQRRDRSTGQKYRSRYFLLHQHDIQEWASRVCGRPRGYDESQARVSIAALVYSIAGRRDLTEFKACTAFLKAKDAIKVGDHYGEYTAYYKAQALFQADIEAWEKWNKLLIQELRQSQKQDGRFDGSFGSNVATSLSLLSLALNFRFLPIYER